MNRNIKWLDENNDLESSHEIFTTCNISLIDFGVSRLYLDRKSGKHVPNKTVNTFVGNIIFASPNALRGQTLSRRDDIIQIIFNLVFLMNSSTNWINEIKFKNNLLSEMRKFKMKATVEEFCRGERC